MTYRFARKKLQLEQLLMAPFVVLGKLAGYFINPGTTHQVYLFIPNGDIGGSPQVNIDLIHCIKDKKPLVVFSKKPNNNQFREKYNIEGVRVLDIHRYIDNKLFHFVNFFFRGLLASRINRSKDAVVFGGESIFFYKMLPHLKKEVRCIELCHLDTWLPYSIGFIDRINYRVFSTENLKKKVEAQYRENGLAASYFDRLFFHDNAIDIPEYKPVLNDELQVYFIGRGAAQKRVHLTARIARVIHEKKLPVKFNFVGDVDRIIDPVEYPFCRFYGNVKDQEQMKKIYEEADVLLMTSSFEGLPIVVMQMMAYGKVVVSTAVDAIPDYIHHMENGLLIRSADEEEIVIEGAGYIEQLQKDKELRARLGKKNRETAVGKFSRESFCSAYRHWFGF